MPSCAVDGFIASMPALPAAMQQQYGESSGGYAAGGYNDYSTDKHKHKPKPEICSCVGYPGQDGREGPPGPAGEDGLPGNRAWPRPCTHCMCGMEQQQHALMRALNSRCFACGELQAAATHSLSCHPCCLTSVCACHLGVLCRSSR